jgi:predicted glycosyltransferase involved in capsule biosynthesis
MTRVVEEEPKCSGSMREGKNKTLTLKIGFVYHDRNNTCIHMRTEDSNIIYMYKRGRIYQEPHKNIIIERLHISKKVLRRIEDSLWLNYSVTRLNKKIVFLLIPRF